MTCDCELCERERPTYGIPMLVLISRWEVYNEKEDEEVPC